jgi:secondary thiamine-phosphate synthase enzyme
VYNIHHPNKGGSDMAVFTTTLSFDSKGRDDMLNITSQVQDVITAGSINEGIVTVFVPGSTASVTTIEHEPGLKKDFPRAMERLAPSDAHYDHDAKWGDGNGMSHVRASTVGPGIVVPFKDKMMLLGTWQQVVLVDFDTRPRKRTVIVQVLG